jgi:serine/threonine protein kinase
MAQLGLQDSRAHYSHNRLAELRNRLGKLPELQALPGLTVFAAGSYGRLEASEHSDIDIFFFIDGDGKNLKERRTNELRMFGKVLPPYLADSSESRERFEREARTIAGLNHRHICTLYDIGHQDGTDFLVMEYLEIPALL